MIFLGASSGLMAGALLLFASHIAPRFGAGNFIRDVDQPKAFGKTLSRREAHVLGAFIHLTTSLFFGLTFALLVRQGFISGFFLLPIVGWSVVSSLFIGMVVMPLEGHGWFGIKHDTWFVVDVFLTNILWGLLYYGLMLIWRSPF